MRRRPEQLQRSGRQLPAGLHAGHLWRRGPGHREDCDDGNDQIGDGCRPDCSLEVCGDGINDPQEQCDDGALNSNDPDACRPDCTLPICGDAVQDTSEECDDGNNADGDGCRGNCTLEICGDGIRDAPAEQCDDGNDVSGDGCEPDCTVTPGFPVPTVSEWGLIIMGLLFVALGAVAILRNRSVFAGAGDSSLTLDDEPSLFVPKQFVRMLLVTVGLASIGLLGAASLGLGPTGVDVVGSLLCAPIVAYLLHLWSARRPN